MPTTPLTKRETEESVVAMATSKSSRIPTDVTMVTNTRDPESLISLTSDTEPVTTKVSASDKPTADTVLAPTDMLNAPTTVTPMVATATTLASLAKTSLVVTVLPRHSKVPAEASVLRTLADADMVATADTSLMADT